MKHYATKLFEENVKLKLENRKLRSCLEDIFKSADYNTEWLRNGSSFELIDRKIADFGNTVAFIKKRREELGREVAELERINTDLAMKRYLDENGQFKEMM